MFEKLFFIRREVALATYLDPSLLQTKKSNHSYVPIFPFGCNNSQYDAVKNAMENQISIIQGPPGTGKTDRKSTRLNSSHANISYAVFCLQKLIIRSEIHTTDLQTTQHHSCHLILTNDNICSQTQ